jgi:type II secretory pathway pseudopilin PulG
MKRLTLPRLVVLLGTLVMVAVVGALAIVIVTRQSTANDVARVDRAQVVRLAQTLRAYGYKQDVKNWHEKLSGCARSKTDRNAIAKALRAQSTYLNGVLAATSVKRDVKTAATMAQDRFNASATDLESRTGRNFSCLAAYPKPAVPTGVVTLP